MSRARVHPCGLTFVRLLKHGVGYDKLVLCAGGEEQSTVRVFFTNSVGTKDASPGTVVSTHLCVKVSQKDELVISLKTSTAMEV